MTWATTGKVVLRRNVIGTELRVLDLQCLILRRICKSQLRQVYKSSRDRVVASLALVDELVEDATVAVTIAARARRPADVRLSRSLNLFPIDACCIATCHFCVLDHSCHVTDQM